MTVTVADDLFEGEEAWPDGDGWSTQPYFLVVTDQTEAAAAALAAADSRLMHIDDQGVELATWQLFNAEHFTPSYVSPVYLTERGPALSVDTDGELSRLQADAMVRVITEELERRGVSGHIAAPDPHSLAGRSPEWTAPAVDEELEADVVEAWFVHRYMEARTTTGERYEDVEWLAADRSWVWELSAAKSFADPPMELIAELNRLPLPADRRAVSALRLPVDGYDDPSLPPVEIRQRPH